MKKVREYVKVILAIAFVYVLFYVTDIGCPIKFITGISCMGCGMTRAYVSLFRGDFHSAFAFHPLFFLPALWVIIYLFKAKIPKKIYKILIFLTLFLFFAVYLFRLFDISDTIVVVEPKSGLVYKILCGIYSFIRHK